MCDGDEVDVRAVTDARREAVASAWSGTTYIVLIGAGEPIHIPGRMDMTYRFVAHAEYFYLTDRNRPGGVLAFDPDLGWIDFVRPVTLAERLWSGVSPDDDTGTALSELAGWIRARTPRPVVWLGCPPAGATFDHEIAEDLRLIFSAARRTKDGLELGRMRIAERATRAAFNVAAEQIRAGTSERGLQIAMEAEAFRRGADAMAYETIVGGGANSAILHFPPSDRRLKDGDLVLIDCGAEYRGYASDVTRTYVVGGEPSPLQAHMHAVVTAANRAAVTCCRDGSEWSDVHLLAAQAIASGLVEAGVLRGSTDTLIESGAIWLFFPHGIGHLVGLGVRDAADPLPERRHRPAPFPVLRIDLPLRSGMVVTVEPGVYFVPAILNESGTRRRYRTEVKWSCVDHLLGFGGIRIEDDVLVTDSGPAVLTADIPSYIESAELQPDSGRS